MVIMIRENVEIIVDSEEKALEMQKKGFKRLTPAKTEEKPDFSEMTKAQLLEYAAEHNIEVNPRAKKADILAAL